jgi:hypothetical protein
MITLEDEDVIVIHSTAALHIALSPWIGENNALPRDLLGLLTLLCGMSSACNPELHSKKKN